MLKKNKNKIIEATLQVLCCICCIGIIYNVCFLIFIPLANKLVYWGYMGEYLPIGIWISIMSFIVLISSLYCILIIKKFNNN